MITPQQITTQVRRLRMHDHDMTTEDIDAPESTWEEITIADKQIGNALIEFRCDENDNGYDDFRFVVRTLNKDYPARSRAKWVDECEHATALEAVEDANYINKSPRAMSTMMVAAATLHVMAARYFQGKESE